MITLWNSVCWDLLDLLCISRLLSMTQYGPVPHWSAWRTAAQFPAFSLGPADRAAAGHQCGNITGFCLKLVSWSCSWTEKEQITLRMTLMWFCLEYLEVLWEAIKFININVQYNTDSRETKLHFLSFFFLPYHKVIMNPSRQAFFLSFLKYFLYIFLYFI